MLLISACETTRETKIANIGALTTNVKNVSFNKKKAAVGRVNSGLTYLNVNNFERAKFHLDRALKYDPSSGNVNYAFGIYYQRVKAFKKSQQHFDKALAADSNNPLYLNAYGAFLCDVEDFKKADKMFQQAIEIPTYTDIAYAFYNVGFCALKQGNIEKAEKNFRKALNRNRRMADALIEMAKIEFSKERYSRAMAYIKRFENNGRTTPESAWLGLKAAHYMRDKDGIASYSLILENRFPDSDETAKYLDDKQQWM